MTIQHLKRILPLLLSLGISVFAADPTPPLSPADAKAEVVLGKMNALAKDRRWKDIIEQFKGEDLTLWKDATAQKVAAVASLRAKAYVGIDDPASAEKELKFAAQRAPKLGDALHELAALYSGALKNDALAMEAYDKAFERAGKSFGWVSLSSTLGSAGILMKQGKAAEAQQVMARYDASDVSQLAGVWGEKMRALNEQIAEKLSGSLLLIADKGVSKYQIVLPDTYPTPAIAEDMKQVARLLQTAFKANGAELPVVAESARDKARPAIYLGDTAFARSHGVDVKKLKGWSYVHKAVARDIIIAGRDETAPGRGTPATSGASFDRIGTAKAVTDFLQSHVGTRFLFPEQGGFAPLAGVAKVDLLTTPTIEYLPTPRIAVPPNLDLKKTPVLEYDITWPPTVSFYHLAQNRFPAIDSTFGGHTWHRAIPCTEADFAAHPEHFALLGGKRQLTGGGGQIQFCLANPEVQELLYQDLEKHFKMGFQTVDLGQPDGFRGCECAACTKLFGTGSDWSEKLWIFNRKLAERAHKAFPDRTVAIAVYAVTETLPKTFDSFPPNVQFFMCGTRDHELAAWRKLGAPQGFSTYLYYWCPNLMPRYFPMRTPLYVENAAKRLMAASVRSIARDGNGGTAFGLEGPTYYTMGRMFDGPGAHTAKNLVIEYVNAAFGKSSPAMMSFYDQLYNSLEIYARYLATREDGWSFTDMYGRGHKHLSSPESVMAFLYPVDLIKGMEKQLTLAEKTDPSPKVQTRLALVRAEFAYLKDVINSVHLYNAYQVSPDAASLDRLLNKLDAWRASVDKLFAKGNQLKGWPYTLFPPMGHSADALKLKYDGYQEPYKNAFFNWDTAAKRQAPLPNAKQILAAPAKGPVTIDSPQWEGIAAQALTSTTASNPKPLTTQVRVLHDDSHLYLRFENTLPANAPPEAIERERVEACFMPDAGRPVTYRFSAGLKPDSRTQAARGLIEDMMNLGYGKFDPLWKAAWTHNAIHDRKANRLTVMLTIPLQSIPPATIKPDQNWFVNFQRTSATGAYAWSVIPGGAGIDDPRSNGELSFNSNGSSASSSTQSLSENAVERGCVADQPQPPAPPGRRTHESVLRLVEDDTAALRNFQTGSHALKLLREQTYRETFEVPSQWRDRIAKGPAIALKDWRFRADPTEVGAQDAWFKPERYSETDWMPVQVATFWGENEAIGNLLGEGWYRVTFIVPASSRDKTLQLMFAGVDEQAWVYLNGKLVGEHSEKSENKKYTALYDEPFIVEVPIAQLQLGTPNVLTVRVHNQVGAGGIWRPVHAIEVRSSKP